MAPDHEVTFTYLVAGMSCGSCRALIAEELEDLPGVQAVAVDLASKRVSVTGDARLTDEVARGAIAGAGYEAVPA